MKKGPTSQRNRSTLSTVCKICSNTDFFISLQQNRLFNRFIFILNKVILKTPHSQTHPEGFD